MPTPAPTASCLEEQFGQVTSLDNASLWYIQLEKFPQLFMVNFLKPEDPVQHPKAFSPASQQKL
jgi:hypothetical protein